MKVRIRTGISRWIQRRESFNEFRRSFLLWKIKPEIGNGPVHPLLLGYNAMKPETVAGMGVDGDENHVT